MSMTVPAVPLALAPAQAGALDGLVADGRAIGVRVVLDLTCKEGPGASAARGSAAVVVPVEAFDLVDGLPTYGC
jgi:hypothetical protein